MENIFLFYFLFIFFLNFFLLASFFQVQTLVCDVNDDDDDASSRHRNFSSFLRIDAFICSIRK